MNIFCALLVSSIVISPLHAQQQNIDISSISISDSIDSDDTTWFKFTIKNNSDKIVVDTLFSDKGLIGKPYRYDSELNAKGIILNMRPGDTVAIRDYIYLSEYGDSIIDRELTEEEKKMIASWRMETGISQREKIVNRIKLWNWEKFRKLKIKVHYSAISGNYELCINIASITDFKENRIESSVCRPIFVK